MLRTIDDLDDDLAALEATGDPATLAAVRELLARYGLLSPVTVSELAERLQRTPRWVRELAHKRDGDLEGLHIPDSYLLSASSAKAVETRYRTAPPSAGRPRKPRRVRP